MARVATRKVPSGQAKEARPVGKTANPRRAMFRAAAERWQASGQPANEPAAGTEPVPEPFREVVQRHSVNPKRTDLLNVLSALPGRQPVSKVVSAAEVPLAQLSVDRNCVGCNVCETLCPVGALSHCEEGGRYTLELDAAQCTGCGVCEAVCFHQAIHLRDTVDLSVLFGRLKADLIILSRHTCPTCRESFLGETSGSCPSCRLSGDRREATVRRFFMGGN
jgi:formate hydrogenlyase subunit 6/NADH:ubiquinone oxidoreductase subunit I